MSTININPITRISGFMEIEVKVEGYRVVDANCSGLLFRGFEKMLVGRSPLDAVYFTERICGICSAAHSMTSSLALEDALKVHPSENSRMLRDIIHGFEFIQNHLRHFYLYTLPDFIVTPDIQPVYSQGSYDLRLPKELNDKISKDYLEAVKYSRLAHKAQAVLGGKAPHNHGIFIGGVTEGMDAEKYIQIKALTEDLKGFITNRMVEDADIISRYYGDYFKMGKGYGNLMTYGAFDTYSDKAVSYVAPQLALNGYKYVFEPNRITENIFNSWYQGDTIQSNLFDENTEPDSAKKAYSWVKAPRYEESPMEVGPLARMILSGDYPNRVSMMDRTIARVLETRKIIGIIENLLEKAAWIEGEKREYKIPETSKGAGLTDTTRGSLGHWVSIKNQRIEHYNIITPSVWNCSPTDSSGVKGVIEKSLIGTEIKNIKEPVEVGRIVRSFDPCISCATHVISDRFEPVEIVI